MDTKGIKKGKVIEKGKKRGLYDVRPEDMTKEERKEYNAWFIKYWEERYGKKFPMKRFGRAFFEKDEDEEDED